MAAGDAPELRFEKLSQIRRKGLRSAPSDVFPIIEREMRRLLLILLLLGLAGCTADQPRLWQAHDTPLYSFELPPRSHKVNSGGIDSSAEDYRCPGLDIGFDFYSYSADRQRNINVWPATTECEDVIIDGKPARIASTEERIEGLRYPYTTWIKFDNLASQSTSNGTLRLTWALVVTASCKTHDDRAVARRIFSSIKIKPRDSWPSKKNPKAK
jgi:hypothetical protein